MKFKTQLLLGNGVILIFMVIIAIVQNININSLNETSASVEHTEEVINNARNLEKLFLDMETAERGFLITGKEEFLKSYHDGKTNFDIIINQTKTFVSDNNSQVLRLQEIHELSEQWLQTAALPEIKMRRKLDKNTATIQDIAALIEAGTGKAILGSLRVKFETFIDIEKKLLKDAKIEHESMAVQSELFTIVGTILAIVLGVIISLYITRKLMKQIGGEPFEIMNISNNLVSSQQN